MNNIDLNNINNYINLVNSINDNNKICKLNFKKYFTFENNFYREIYTFYNNGFIILDEYAKYIFNKINLIDLSDDNKRIILQSFSKYKNFHNYIINNNNNNISYLTINRNNLINYFNLE